MLKIAMLATAVLAAASTAAIESIAATPVAAPATGLPCRPGQALDLACYTRAIDTDGNGTISAAELANFSMPPAAVATPLQPTPDAGLAFQDAAAETGSVLPTSLAPEKSQPLVPALFALGALVVLLRKRPT